MKFHRAGKDACAPRDFRGASTILAKIIFISLLLLLVLTPLPYGAVEVWSTALWEASVLALALLWGVEAALKGRLTIALNPLAGPLLALLVIALVQLAPIFSGGERATLSFDRHATWQAVVKLLASIFFLLLCATFVNTRERRQLAVGVIIAVCVFVALVGIGQSYLGKLLWQRGTFGPFVNRNHFAGFLAMGAGLAGGLLVARGARREWLALYASAALCCGAGIVLSASRGGVLALAAETVFLALAAAPVFGADSVRTGALRAAAALVLGLAAIAGAAGLVGSEKLAENFAQTGADWQTETPASERYSRRDIWGATIQMIKDQPLTGVGLGAFPFAYTRYDPSSGAQRVEQAHNDYLQIVADAGVLGGVLALVFLLLLFGRGFQAAAARDRPQRALAIGALAGCFAIAIHSFVDFNLQITANAQLFLALAALATQQKTERGA
jgi:O-antigen ligase